MIMFLFINHMYNVLFKLLFIGRRFILGAGHLIFFKAYGGDDWVNPWHKAANQFNGFGPRQPSLGDNSMLSRAHELTNDFMDWYMEYHYARSEGKIHDDFFTTFSAPEFKTVSVINLYREHSPFDIPGCFFGYDFEAGRARYWIWKEIAHHPFVSDPSSYIGGFWWHPVLRKASAEFLNMIRQWPDVVDDVITAVMQPRGQTEQLGEYLERLWAAFSVEWHRAEWWLWELNYRDSVEILKRFDIEPYNHFTNTWIFPASQYYFCARLGLICALATIIISSLALALCCYSLGRAHNLQIPKYARNFEFSLPFYYLGRVSSYGKLPNGFIRSVAVLGPALHIHTAFLIIAVSIYGLVCLPYIIVPDHKGPSGQDDSYVWDADQYYPWIRIWKQYWRAFVETYAAVTEGALPFQVIFFLFCLTLLIILPAVRQANRQGDFWWYEWRRICVFIWFLFSHYGVYIALTLAVGIVFEHIHPPLARPFSF